MDTSERRRSLALLGLTAGLLLTKRAQATPVSLPSTASVKDYPYRARGDGTTNDAAAFSAADSANANNFVPVGTYSIGTNTTLSNRLEFDHRAILKPASGVTITLNGPVTAGLWQIFDLSAGGTVVLNSVPEVQARWFGASPSASASTNATAINKAIACAKASQSADLIIGPGSFSINATLTYSGPNKGIATIGVPVTSLEQGSASGACVLVWTGGASPMVDVTSSFHTFTGINFVNTGSATHGIRSSGGRLWVDWVKFANPNGSFAFSTATIELTGGVNYDRIHRCEFETGTAVLVSAGLGTTLVIDEFMMESTVGSGAFVDIRGGLAQLTLREGTVDYTAGIKSFIDMSNIGSYSVAVCDVKNNELAGDEFAVAAGSIAVLKNCKSFVFESNLIDAFGAPANNDYLIKATNSRVTIRNTTADGLNKPLVQTLDSASYVYSYENNLRAALTNGVIDPASQSGNLINAVIDSDVVIIQGDLASAMAPSIHLATLTDSVNPYQITIAKDSDISNQGFMTAGQVFTAWFYNNSGGNLVTWSFRSPDFTLQNPLPAPPLNGQRLAITFVWTGTTAMEVSRQHDPTPTWISKTSTATLALGENRIKADATARNLTLTLPRADTAKSGARFTIKKVNSANTVTINSTAGFTIDGASSFSLTAQWSVVTVESDGTQWLIVSV